MGTTQCDSDFVALALPSDFFFLTPKQVECMARVENPFSQVRKGSFREVVFKLRPPDYQQGKRQDEVIQADRTCRGLAGQVELPLVTFSCLWSLRTCFRMPWTASLKSRLLDAAFVGWAQESAFLASSSSDPLCAKDEGQQQVRKGRKLTAAETGKEKQKMHWRGGQAMERLVPLSSSNSLC